MVKYSVYRGDLTKLKVEAIVNAANESGLGCSRRGHCLDAAIHYAAGPKLLEECKLLNGIPTTVAKITLGYNLPCKYILHATGPRISFEGKCDFAALAKTYTNCLQLAKTNNISELAFCCLSTGIFGFPKLESAKVAIDTVISWLNNNEHSFTHIIFDVFTYEDHIIYLKLFEGKNLDVDTLTLL